MDSLFISSIGTSLCVHYLNSLSSFSALNKHTHTNAAAEQFNVARFTSDAMEVITDPNVDAVWICSPSQYHAEQIKACAANGKHVFCEKPIGLSVEEVLELQKVVDATGKTLQVGHMLRFDPGIQSAKDFLTDEMGEILALKAWYCDSTARYTNTDAIQPMPRTGSRAIKPSENPKANLRRNAST